ncbi:MAG TPA: substrate-binding domain-containing protein [Gemmatimonadaceae bacterium]|nr:substrate-binding domain-containing protein [Gemmatimonadaceae bacterium]
MLVRSLLVVAALLFASRAGAQSQYVVVVNATNPATSLSRDAVSRLFLKKVTLWPNEEPVVPVDQPERSMIRMLFSREVHGREVTTVRTYWKQQIFGGRSVPPDVRASDASVISFVAEHPGGVGYVSANARLNAKVKAIRIE